MQDDYNDEIIDGEVKTIDGNTSISDDKAMVVADTLLPKILPLFPLAERPLFPKTMHPLVFTDKRIIKAIMEARDKSSNYIGLALIKSDGIDPPKVSADSIKDLYKVGVVAKILQVAPLVPGQPLQILVQVLERFEVIAALSNEIPFRVKVEYKYDKKVDVNDEMKAYSVTIINSLKELVTLNPLFKEQLNMLMTQMNVYEPGILADMSATLTTASGEELQQVLETYNVRERVEQVLVLIKKELEISKLQSGINKRINERLTTQQREFFLKQQLKEIQKELGISKEEKETEVDKFEKRLKDLKLSDEAKERVSEEMEKLKTLEPSSPEYNVTRTYLDWLTLLPWGVYTEDNQDIKKAAKILDQDHYGLPDVKDRILELISVGILKGDLAGSIVLFVGAPGVGKTSIGQSIARSLGRKFFRFSLGGMRDEAEIKGHRRTYIGAMPGKFIQTMKTCKTANPVIMLDEIDKIGASFQGDPASALLEVLDPEQNTDFLDHYLDVRFDLSKVLFLCTANQLETIPRPLLDRMEVIQLSGYILEEKLEIAKKFLIPKQMKMHGLTTKQVSIPKAVTRKIIEDYAREAGVRSLENNIKKILRKSSRKIVEGKEKKVKIGIEDLPDILGKKMYGEDKKYKKPRVGVIMGLAYTSLGGATLYIEATKVPSKGPGFKQTGQLGSVMVESSEIAYTYVRSYLADNETASEFFNSSLVHLHVPAGATPKDGPSAGITMACAIYSLVMGRPIIKDVAMTGELTLSGLVMPIGGVKEKVIAAKRAKVKKILLPEDNKEDFDALDDAVKKGIKPFFMSTFEEAIALCFRGK